MDDTLLIAINQGWASPGMDRLFLWLSNRAGFGFPLMLITLALLAKRWGRAGIKLWLILVGAVLLGDLIGNLLKHLLQQPRPCVVLFEQLRSPTRAPGTPCAGMASGMPSNHTLNFFLFATLLGRLLHSWRIGLGLGLIAAAVGLSRIYLGVHYPSQVLAGMFLGITLGWLAASAAIRYLPWVERIHQHYRTRHESA